VKYRIKKIILNIKYFFIPIWSFFHSIKIIIIASNRFHGKIEKIKRWQSFHNYKIELEIRKLRLQNLERLQKLSDEVGIPLFQLASILKIDV